jgi:hypothetical protein
MTQIKMAMMALLLCSCAQLHHVQLGEIIDRPDFVQKPFDIKVSETGVNIQEAKGIAKALLNNAKDRGAADQIAGVLGLFQMGPRTGNPVFVKDYAANVAQLIYEKCPSGQVTGLMSVRESRKYPVISGEIVKITGYCLIRKGS